MNQKKHVNAEKALEASKDADRYGFDTDNLDRPTISKLIEKMEEANEYDVLIIDSLTHSWQELLEEMDKLANAKYKGNTWSAWSEGTPKQRELVRAILSFPGHIIATMRSKTEWTTEKDSNGKSRPQRVGLAPEQGKGIEYEFDMLIELSTDHIANVIKDRTGKFQDELIDKPGEDFGESLVLWLNTGVKKQTKAEKMIELGEWAESESIAPEGREAIKKAIDDPMVKEATLDAMLEKCRAKEKKTA